MAVYVIYLIAHRGTNTTKQKRKKIWPGAKISLVGNNAESFDNNTVHISIFSH